MKLLIYGINYAPEETSTGKYTGEMGSWFAARGHDVTAIVAPPYYPQWRVGKGYSSRSYLVEDIDGVRTNRVPLFVPNPENVSARNRILHETSFSIASTRYWLPLLLRKQTYDAVIAVCPPVQMGAYPLIYSRLRGVPFVFHVQDLQVDVAVRLQMLKNAAMASILYKIEDLLLRFATRVSTITETMRRRVVQKGVPERKTWLFPNWADVSLVRPLPRDNEVRREFGVGPNDVLVLYAGNMGEKQGLNLMLDAAGRLKGRKRLGFAMVGSGAARKRLERLVEQRGLDNVRFYPLQPLERLPEMLAAGDIHLVVQRREAADLVMPSKLTNILAAGRPAVATAEPGTALYDTLNEHDCGIVTTPGNVEELVAALIMLSEDAQTRERLGRNGRRYAEDHLDKDKILTRFESKLLALVKEKA